MGSTNMKIEMSGMKWIALAVAVLALHARHLKKALNSFPLADARPWRGKGTWGPWGTNYYHWNWNPATLETIDGEVKSKDTITPPQGRKMLPAVGMTLKIDKGDVYVHLGPQWYFDKQELAINRGDTVEVTGSKTVAEGNTVLLASSVKKGDKTWQFRDQQGFPFWSGKRW
jgi:hypothetical protein